MARGAEAKLRRRNRKKEAAALNDEVFDETEDNAGTDDIPLPPSMSKSRGTPVVEPDNSDAEDEDNMPKRRRNKSSQKVKAAPSGGGGGGGGIKRTPLILLLIMMGTTLLPAFIYAGDFISGFLAKNDIMGQVGFRLGIGSVPRRRVISFYEKHAPEKLDDVPGILAKHYGDYPKLVKKLERKYQDYGYFMGWENDEAPMRIAWEGIQEAYDVWLTQYWNRYAPQALKTGARNIRYNLTFLYKKGRKLWTKHAWPVLEPVFGVPEGAEAQKRKDKAEARKRKTGSTSGGTKRRKNTEFRDDEP